MHSLENAVMVLTTVFKDDKAKTAKKAKLLIAAAAKAGAALEFEKPGRGRARLSGRKGAGIGHAPCARHGGRAGAAVRHRPVYAGKRACKLAAVCGYTEVTPALVQQMGTLNIEADVFEMVRFVTANQLPRALHKLSQLFDAAKRAHRRHGGAFWHVYRHVPYELGAAQRRPAAMVMKDFAYRGSDWRLRRRAKARPNTPRPA